VEGSKRAIIGVDESGKGDFFGPLVIAGVLAAEDSFPALAEMEVRDSKTIADKKLMGIADRIQRRFVHDVIVINPEKYNQLHKKIGNLNKLLGWGHARVIENILAQQPATAAISDKFGHERFILDSLQKMGRTIEIIQTVRGEAHPAVAAASILARAEFLRRMEMLSQKVGMTLPRGASSLVDDAGRRLVRENGVEILEQIAKLHFKNYQKISGRMPIK
jgi:ribonuclease HIII